MGYEPINKSAWEEAGHYGNRLLLVCVCMCVAIVILVSYLLTSLSFSLFECICEQIDQSTDYNKSLILVMKAFDSI